MDVLALFEDRDQADRHAADHVNLACAERRTGREGIFHDAKVQGVEVGQTWFVIRGIFHQGHVITRHKLFEPVGSRAAGCRTQSLPYVRDVGEAMGIP